MFVLFEIFWKLGYNLIKNYKFLEIKRLSSENGSFSCEVPFWILDRFHYIVVALYICLQAGGLDSKPDYGSICWVSSWWLEMFKGRCG